jgi:large subunit ribosomal protein L23
MAVIIEKPVVSEKASLNIAQNKYIFYVNRDSNKIEIKNFIEKKFEVSVESVNICNVKGKKRRRGRIVGRTKDRKKAIVTLKAGSELTKIKELF